jgi:hypothetical protein
MTSPFALPIMGGSLLAAVVFGIHLGESSIGQINPIYFQGPAIHPRDRGVAIDESNRPAPARPAYGDLYGWDEGEAARAVACHDCGRSRARDAYAYSAEVPYFGSREEFRESVRQARDELGEGFVESTDPVVAPSEPVLRYAYYPITEDEAARPASAEKEEALLEPEQELR